MEAKPLAHNTGVKPKLTCAKCGAPVRMEDDKPVRDCGHNESVITADLKAIVYGISSLKH